MRISDWSSDVCSSDLPYGVQKRIELGRALSMQPRLLLLDEPVAGMNLAETEDMARHIIQIRERLGLAMVLVEHDMHMVMNLTDREIAPDFGVPLATGSPDDVPNAPKRIAANLGGAARPPRPTGLTPQHQT